MRVRTAGCVLVIAGMVAGCGTTETTTVTSSDASAVKAAYNRGFDAGVIRGHAGNEAQVQSEFDRGFKAGAAAVIPPDIHPFTNYIMSFHPEPQLAGLRTRNYLLMPLNTAWSCTDLANCDRLRGPGLP